MLHKTSAQGKGSSLALFGTPDVMFRWRSGGGGQASVITEGPFDTQGRRTLSCHPMSQDPREFFRELGLFTSFAWREANNGGIEIAILPSRRGWWIGAGGRKIRALQAHLGRKIVLVDGVKIEKEQGMSDEVANRLFSRDYSSWYGLAATRGHCAPWDKADIDALMSSPVS